MHLGVADHLGWAVAVTSDADHRVIDRRRIDLVEAGLTPAPIHYEGAGLELDEAAALVAEVEASVVRATDSALEELATSLPEPLQTIALRAIPTDFPTDLATRLRSPWEARADAVMYRSILVERAEARGLEVHQFEAKNVERQASALLADRADEVLRGPRARLGPPWAKDHRIALAANIMVVAGRAA